MNRTDIWKTSIESVLKILFFGILLSGCILRNPQFAAQQAGMEYVIDRARVTSFAWGENGLGIIAAVAKGREGYSGGVYTLDLESGKTRELTSSGGDSYGNPSWNSISGDIVIWSTYQGVEGIWKIDPDGNSISFVTYGWQADYSPISNSLAIASVIPGDTDSTEMATVVIREVPGAEGKEIYSELSRKYIFYDLEWSPNGKYIAILNSTKAVSSDGEDVLMVTVIDTEGELVHSRRVNEFYGQSISWNDDSNRLLYQISSSSQGSTFQVLSLKGVCHEIQTAVGPINHPKISIDGENFAYLSWPVDGIIIQPIVDVMPEDYWTRGAPCN